MKYNLANPNEAGRAMIELARLTQEKKIVDMKSVKPKRSLNQNAYLHILLGYFGMCLGYTREEAKMIYKRLPGNKDIYVYTKDVGGRPMEFMRSSADLNKEEMQKSIDVLREWSARMGYELPTATDPEWLRQIENQVEKEEKYL